MEQVMLDMIPTGAKAVCHVSQYDIGRIIRFNLISGGAVYTLSGTETVKVYIKKPDGTTAERNIANTSSTYVDWVTGEGDCDQAGKCECELVITSGTTVIGSKNFTVNIEEDPYNEQGVVTETAGPAVIATFTTNVVDLLQEVKCSINPIQNGTPWIDSNEVNKVPYIKRAVAGTATRIGNHLYDKLVGGTVAFNQVMNYSTYPASSVVNGITFTNNGDGSITVSGTASAMAEYNTGMTPVQQGHKVLMMGCPTGGSASSYFLVDNNQQFNKYDYSNGVIYEITNSNNRASVRIRVASGYAISGTVTFKPQFFDLTKMFGSTIADYIYGLEQATAGAGVAWFKALFPNDYYAYNYGELMSVKATAHVMKNASNQVIGNYALDSNLELRGIPKLDENNKLYYDGDTYESNGSVARKYGIVDLGSVSWNYQSGNTRFYTNTFMSAIKGETTNVVCPIYTVGNTVTDNMSMQVASNGYFYVKNTAYTDPTAFKTAMNGVYLLYELATPTTEQASPFTNPQVCDENGTEEYTDNRAVPIPVGHETYQANICPITGFDELNIQQTGANIWDEEWELGYYNTANGQPLPISDRIRSKNFIPITPETTFRLVMTSSHYIMPLFYDKDKNYLGYIANGVYSTYQNPFTSLANAYYMKFYVSPSYGTTYNNDISINYPSTDTTYHAYNGDTVTIAFGQTVYGGVLDVTRGKLSVTHISFDMGDVYWAREEDSQSPGIYYFRYLTSPLAKQGSVCNCSCYETYTGTGVIPDLKIKVSGAGQYVFIRARDDNYTDGVSFTTSVRGQRVVYELATPFDIDLTPVQVEQLLGVNNVWHDGNGNTEVKYLYNA